MGDIIARDARQLGAIVRRLRKSRKLTQDRLAALMSVRQATVSRLEQGAPTTQLGMLMDALSALDLELVVRPRTKGQVQEIEDLF
jgi:HTH-type transcriptional regulator / antitoxin HipB